MENQAMGLEANSAGHYPKIASTALIHPTATIVGRVRIGERAFVGPNAVIRADEVGSEGFIEPIVVGEDSNIQDCAIIHALGGTGVEIGRKTSIAHAAIVHGPCKIGDRCFIGFHSVVFHATLADGAMVMHQALVERAVLSKGVFVPSMTAVRCDEEACRLEQATEDMIAFAAKVISANIRLVRQTQRLPVASFGRSVR